MKYKIGLLCTALSVSTFTSAEIKLIEKTKDALEFASYIDTRPDNVILFETTTREIDFDKKTAIIMEVGKMSPNKKFDVKNYALLKNEFTLDFSKIEITEEFNRNNYPQQRFQDDCNLRVKEYGLFVEGKFIKKNVFEATNIKRKYLDELHDYYCQPDESNINTFKKEVEKNMREEIEKKVNNKKTIFLK